MFFQALFLDVLTGLATLTFFAFVYILTYFYHLFSFCLLLAFIYILFTFCFDYILPTFSIVYFLLLITVYLHLAFVYFLLLITSYMLLAFAYFLFTF